MVKEFPLTFWERACQVMGLEVVDWAKVDLGWLERWVMVEGVVIDMVLQS